MLIYAVSVRYLYAMFYVCALAPQPQKISRNTLFAHPQAKTERINEMDKMFKTTNPNNDFLVQDTISKVNNVKKIINKKLGSRRKLSRISKTSAVKKRSARVSLLKFTSFFRRKSLKLLN